MSRTSPRSCAVASICYCSSPRWPTNRSCIGGSILRARSAFLRRSFFRSSCRSAILSSASWGTPRGAALSHGRNLCRWRRRRRPDLRSIHRPGALGGDAGDPASTSLLSALYPFLSIHIDARAAAGRQAPVGSAADLGRSPSAGAHPRVAGNAARCARSSAPVDRARGRARRT